MNRLLAEGDIFNLPMGVKVYAKVPKHFLYDNKRGDWELAHGDVKVANEFSFLAGEYVATKTVMDGGSSGRDPYPNGHHVFCTNTDNGYEIDFYQSGCFTAMIEDIEPTGKAELIWKKKEKGE